MANCNPAKTPMENNIQLPILNKAKIDITEYQRCIGSLMYLIICTRPDITYSVGVLSCHVLLTTALVIGLYYCHKDVNP